MLPRRVWRTVVIESQAIGGQAGGELADPETSSVFYFSSSVASSGNRPGAAAPTSKHWLFRTPSTCSARRAVAPATRRGHAYASLLDDSARRSRLGARVNHREPAPEYRRHEVPSVDRFRGRRPLLYIRRCGHRARAAGDGRRRGRRGNSAGQAAGPTWRSTLDGSCWWCVVRSLAGSIVHLISSRTSRGCVT
jgi:hypothetical protein